MAAVAGARRFHRDEAEQGSGSPSFGSLVAEADRVNITADLRVWPSEAAPRNVDRERGW